MKDPLVSAEKIIDCLSDGVYVCDRERRIVYWSKAAEQITGWKSEDVHGRACLEDILNHVDKDGHRLCGEEYCPLHRSMITGEATRVPVIVFTKGGGQWLSAIADCGAQAVGLDWTTDIATARQLLGDRVALQGNMSQNARVRAMDVPGVEVLDVRRQTAPVVGHADQ